ncbi:MAG TPA: thioesterase family protein [Planctomycetota bacterium]
MIFREATYRILYRDIDSMGYLYYGRYLALFELGRVEWMREGGVRYRDVEQQEGLMLPVTQAHCRYRAPLRYDDLARIRTRVAAWSATTLRFAHEVLSSDDGRLCATGEVELGCMDAAERRPARLPERLRTVLDDLAPESKGRKRS